MMYNLYISLKGSKKLIARGTKEEISKREDEVRAELRKEDSEGALIDVYTMSDAEIEKLEKARNLWDTLTEEDKKDYIVVDGKKYIRKIYEAQH